MHALKFNSFCLLPVLLTLTFIIMDQGKAPFNMAINTLERVGEILRDLHKTESDSMLSPAQKQFIMISHVKQLFSQASPLLSVDGINNETKVNGLRDRVMKLRSEETTTARGKGGLVFSTHRRLVFSQTLEDEIFKLQVDIQRELQSLKYFMPPRKDISSAIGSFG